MTQYSDYYATLMKDGKIRALCSSFPPKELGEGEISLSFIEYKVLTSIPLSATRNGLELSELQDVVNSVGQKIKEAMENKK